MLFSSTIFLFAFLPIVLVVYFLLHKPYRNYFLLLASLIFYAWGEPKFVIVMITSIIANYIFGLVVDKYREDRRKAKTCLVFSIIVNLGLLFVFKYLNFAVSIIDNIFGEILPQTNIPLPIGISFFTFQAMSYVIDVYRRDVDVQKNPFYVGMYISFFPQLIAGPIVRYSTIEEQIKKRRVTLDGFSYGVKRFLMGFSKKVLLANTLAVVADEAFAITQAGELSVSFAWLGAICYTFQIFFDFSGYSDMAIGLGHMFGFQFLENFNYPYISQSVSEFWRRWHISLGSWFRDYVYIPLGGSRVKKSRLVFNLFVVWLLTGTWHGASWNFIAWGLLYFVLLTFEKLSGYPEKFESKTAKVLYRVFTLLCVVLGWVLFRAEGLGNAVNYGASMFGLAGNAAVDDLTIRYLSENWVYLLAAVLCSTPLFKYLKEKSQAKPLLGHTANGLTVVAYLGLFLFAVSFLVMGAHNPFIYFNF